MLQVPLTRLSLSVRRAYGAGGAQVIVVAGLIGEGGRRIALPGVALELLLGAIISFEAYPRQANTAVHHAGNPHRCADADQAQGLASVYTTATHGKKIEPCTRVRPQ